LDPKKYIESGIIEDYLMGFVSEQERQEVQCMSKIYPEINEALRQAEDIMSTWAAASAEEPPAGMKEKIMANLGEQEKGPVAMPALKVVASSHEPSVKSSINPAASQPKSSQPIGWIAAAAALILSFFLAYQWQDSLQFMQAMEQEIVAQDQELETLGSQLQELQGDKEQYQSLWAAVSEPGTQKITLNTVQEDKPATATVYWNPEKEQTLFYRDQLPAEAENSQYQLWAIVKGKPVSIGLLALNSNELQLQNMSGLSEADAFAITLEPLGGSESPTLDQMVVMGKV